MIIVDTNEPSGNVASAAPLSSEQNEPSREASRAHLPRDLQAVIAEFEIRPEEVVVSRKGTLNSGASEY